MADKVVYPQIPSTVWWGVRNLLQKNPSVTIDEKFLSADLGVQKTAARAYINELRNAKILTEENKATPSALKWRLDDNYQQATVEIANQIYPEGLMQLAPPGSADRTKVISWLMSEGLGKGAAGNKAATYLLITSDTPNGVAKQITKNAAGDVPAKPRAKKLAEKPSPDSVSDTKAKKTQNGFDGSVSDSFPLNVNVQIHISADAGTDQIESIFKAMRLYLYDRSNS